MFLQTKILQFRILILFLVGIFFLQTNFLRTSAKAESGHGDSHEAPAAEAKHDDKAKEKKNPEWMDLANSVIAVKTKIRMKEELIQKLIEEKHKTKSPEEAAKIVKQMTIEHKDLQKAIAEHEEKRNLLQYRFPEAGIIKERNYERIEGKSLEHMEKQWTLENKIKSSVKNIKAKYQVEANKSAQPEEAKKVKAQENNPLAEPMIISK